MISENSNMIHGQVRVENFDCVFHINYDIEECKNSSGEVESYYVHTDSGYEFSFNAYEDDTRIYVVNLAEELIKDAWEDENV